MQELYLLNRFYAEIHGQLDRPKVVLLHGILGSTANWRSVAKKLSSEFCVLVFDQRGHGRSFHARAEGSGGYAPFDFAQDLKDILDALSWPKVHLVGHSMGGRNAMWFAVAHAKRVDKLIIEDIGPFDPALATNHVVDLLNKIPVPFSNRVLAQAYFRDQFPIQFAHRQRVQAIGAFLYSNLVESKAKEGSDNQETGGLTWRFDEKGMREALSKAHQVDWKLWESISQPTLLVRGSESDELSQTVMEKMLAVQAHSQGVVIDSAGHWVHFDQPEKFVRCVRDFLTLPVNSILTQSDDSRGDLN